MQAASWKALDIAKWFVNATDRESGDDITHLKLQKLLYYAQGWSLAIFDRPLFAEDLEAWAHGPVVVSVWDQFKSFGFQSLPEQKTTRRLDDEAQKLLKAVNSRYGIFTAKHLEKMTHSESPWLNARGDLPIDARCNNKISKKDMKEHFKNIGKGSRAN